MGIIPYIISYIAITVFLIAVLKKIIHYVTNPIHVRWEIYPIPHEAKEKAAYGGGYLEEVDWWKKPRETSKIGEMSAMGEEILLLKAVWENNRPLWYVSYPFHVGLYIIIGFIGLIVIGAVATLIGIDSNSSIMSIIATLTNIVGPLGFTVGFIGATGLLIKRLTDDELSNYTSTEHIMNLILFMFIMGFALYTRYTVDLNFDMLRGYVASLITFSFKPIDNTIFSVQILVAVLTMAYIPLTHMSHFFMKYFLYHDIKWKDTPNIGTPETDQKIGIVLNYPITWAAPHIAIPGKKTWAEVATYNPKQQGESEEK